MAVDLVRIDLVKGSHIAKQYAMKDDMQNLVQICKKAAKCLSHLSCLAGFSKNLRRTSFKISSKISDQESIYESNSTHFLGTLEQTWPVYTIHHEGKT